MRIELLRRVQGFPARGGRIAAAACLGVLLIAMAAASERAASAQPIYSNLGPGATYGPSSVLIGTGLANSFTAARTAVIGQVEVPFAPSQAGATVSVQVSLYAAGSPFSTLIWSATANVSAPGLYTFRSSGAPLTLAANQSYYILAKVTSGTGDASWFTVSTGQSADRLTPFCFADSSCAFFPQSLSFPPALAYRVTDDTAACCSTKTGGCLLLQVATCAGMGLVSGSPGSTCTPNPCHACPGDFNASGELSVQDIFDFLNAWFAGCP